MAAEQLVQATVETLRDYAPFDQMEADALHWLASRLRLGYYPKGATILTHGRDPVRQLFIVKQGAVRGSPSAELRTESLVEIVLGPGECFPIGALIGRRATAYRYVADEDAFLYELDEEDFRAVLDRSPQFQRFCNRYLAALVDQSRRALRSQLAESLSDEGRMLAPLRQIVKREPVACSPATPIREVLRTMQEQRVGAMIVIDDARAPLGIFTHPDVLGRVALAGTGLDAPIATVMTRDPIALPGESAVYQAALAMVQHGIRHIVLVEDGKLSGVVSERDLFTMQRASLRRAAERIRAADSHDALIGAAEDIRLLTRSLLAHGMGAEQLTQVVSALNDTLVRHCVEIGARRHAPAGRWCWIALGSEGRMEQTLATDQDNALILGDGAADKPRFLAFADEVNRALDRCGFPLCKGDIMARNPRWCLTLDEWRETFSDWVRNPAPEALLRAAIFFDLRALAGEAALVGELREWLLKLTTASPAFLRLMASNALQVRAPLGLLRDFVTDDSAEFPGTLDLKGLGARPIVDAARVWALAGGHPQTGTVERLRAASRAGTMPAEEAAASAEAFHFFQSLRMRHQHLESPVRGAENRINPDSLNSLDRRILKAAFRQTVKVQERLRLDYQL